MKCPFWRRCDEKARTIRCEGYLAGSGAATSFRGKRKMEEHIRGRCAGDYSLCPLYRIVREKYD